MTTKSNRGGLRSNPGGRPPKPLDERTAWGGKIAIRISPEAAAQLQRLMLQDVPGVETPEQMIEHLIREKVREEEAP